MTETEIKPKRGPRKKNPYDYGEQGKRKRGQRKQQNPRRGKHLPLSGRAERFCLLIASGKSNKDAWLGAGYSGTNYMFAMGRMLKRSDIQNRIAEHRAVTAIKFEITVENVYQRLDKAYQGAIRKEDYASAVSAAMGIAKIGGLLIDRVNVEHQIVVRPARAPTQQEIELSIEEWREKFKPKLLGGPVNGSGPAAG